MSELIRADIQTPIHFRAQGDANHYVLFQQPGNTWLAALQMNGELTVHKQLAIISRIVDSVNVRERVDQSERRHYAGLAMQGMVSSIHDERGYDRLKLHAQVEGLTVSQWIARDSFKQADAMLAAGEQVNELERLRGERDAMARSILAWWEQAVASGDGGEGGQLFPEEPAFVTQAIALGIEP